MNTFFIYINYFVYANTSYVAIEMCFSVMNAVKLDQVLFFMCFLSGIEIFRWVPPLPDCLGVHTTV